MPGQSGEMRGPGVIVRGMTERAGDRATALSQRVLRAQARLEELMQVLAGSMARLQATRQEIQAGRSQRAVLHDSAYARLEARLASLPVIEQAKGSSWRRPAATARRGSDALVVTTVLLIPGLAKAVSGGRPGGVRCRCGTGRARWRR